MLVRFNETAPQRKEIRLFGEATELPPTDWKYAPIELVDKTLPRFFQTVLDQTPIRGNHKRILVDVKVQNLVPDRESCLPGWHLDGPGCPLHESRPEVHHLFISGGAPTEFIAQKLVMSVPDATTHQKDLLPQIPEDVAVEPIGLNAFYSFTRFDWHRGVFADKPLTRVLIRVTETDVIQPVRYPVKPGVGAR